MHVTIPDPPYRWLRMVIDTCDALVREEMPWRGTRADSELLSSMLHLAMTGYTADKLREWMRSSDEWKQRHAAPQPTPPPAPGPATDIRGLAIQGDHFVSAAGWFFPVLASGFTLASLWNRDRDKANRFIEWMRRTGFHGPRVMLGYLKFGDYVQLPEEARAGLPGLLDTLRSYGMICEATINTGTKSRPYDVEAHTRAVADICKDRDYTLEEIANEPYHSTQSDKINDWSYLEGLAHRSGVNARPYAVGAPNADEYGVEKWPKVIGGSYITVHPGRTRDEVNMARHLREMQGIVSKLNRPVLNNEQIGWDERPDPGKRSNNPDIAFLMGVMTRVFASGIVSHSQHGLTCDLPGATQQACHDMLIKGATIVPYTGTLDYKNSRRGHTWADSPVGEIDDKKVIRAYSGVAGRQAWVIAIMNAGVSNPGLNIINGWRVNRVLATHGPAQVLELTK